MLSLAPIVKQKTKSEEANPVHTTIEDATTVRWSQLRNQIRHHKFQKLDFEEQPHHFQLKHDEASGLIEGCPWQHQSCIENLFCIAYPTCT